MTRRPRALPRRVMPGWYDDLLAKRRRRAALLARRARTRRRLDDHGLLGTLNIVVNEGRRPPRSAGTPPPPPAAAAAMLVGLRRRRVKAQRRARLDAERARRGPVRIEVAGGPGLGRSLALAPGAIVAGTELLRRAIEERRLTIPLDSGRLRR